MCAAALGRHWSRPAPLTRTLTGVTHDARSFDLPCDCVHVCGRHGCEGRGSGSGWRGRWRREEGEEGEEGQEGRGRRGEEGGRQGEVISQAIITGGVGPKGLVPPVFFMRPPVC